MPDVNWTPAALNSQVNGTWELPTKVSLHEDDPGDAGALGVVVSPVSVSWSAAGADGPLGADRQPGTPGRAYLDGGPLSVPTPIAEPYLSYWAGSTFLGSVPILSPIAAGSYELDRGIGR